MQSNGPGFISKMIAAFIIFVFSLEEKEVAPYFILFFVIPFVFVSFFFFFYQERPTRSLRSMTR